MPALNVENPFDSPQQWAATIAADAGPVKLESNIVIELVSIS